MSGGFWAGAVPPWAFTALVVLVILVIGGIALGAWYGYGRGFAHAEEEARWAREQAKARRTHLVYRPDQLLGARHDADAAGSMLSWEYISHEDQALAIANGPMWEYRADHPELAGQVMQVPAITTGEIQAITDRVDEWMATWIGDGHALRDS